MQTETVNKEVVQPHISKYINIVQECK